MSKENIGYIGLGIMGSAMVKNLTKAGHQVSVYARRQASVAALANDKIIAFPSPAELAKACRVVICCVSDTADVEQVLTGPQGVLAGIQHDALVIEMSTICPQATRAMAAKFTQAGAGMLDAPVSGGEAGAIAATLSIMIGGDEEHFQRALPIFKCLGENVIHVGPAGAGQVAKACNNLVAAQTIVAVAEAFLLAQSAHVDAAKVRQALLGGFAYSKVLELHGQRMLDENYTPGFKARLHAKDLRIALKSAQDNAIQLPATRLANEYLQTLIERGDGDLDSAAIARLILGEP